MVKCPRHNIEFEFHFVRPEFLKKSWSEIPPAFIPQTPFYGRENTLAEAGRIHIPRKLFRPAESIFRILHQDFARKKFGFCSGDTATKQNLHFRQNSERRFATRLEFPPEFAKGF